MPLPSNTLRIAVLPGDGIGTEVTAAAIAVLEPLAKRHGIGLAYEELRAGAFCYRDTGTAMSEETFDKAAKADAILLGAMGWPEIRTEDGTEIAPQLDLRFRLNLYAGVRPFRALPGPARKTRSAGRRRSPEPVQQRAGRTADVVQLPA